MTNKIKTTIQNVYEKLREVLVLYEITDCYNTVPPGENVRSYERPGVVKRWRVIRTRQ